MKKSNLLFAVMFGLSSTAAFAVKVGVVDVRKALAESKKALEARAQLDKEAAAKREKLQTEQGELAKIQDELRKNKALSAKAKQDKETDLQKKIMAFQENAKKAEAEMAQREAELTKGFLEGLRSTAEEIGKKRDFDMVIDASALFFAESRSDITTDVMKAYDDKK